MKHLLAIAILLVATLPVTAQFVHPPAEPANNLIEEARVHMWTYNGLRYEEFAAIMMAAHRVNLRRSEMAVRDLEQEIAKVQHEGAGRGLQGHVDTIRDNLSR